MNISILNVGFLEAFHETTFAANRLTENRSAEGGELDVLKISDCIFVCLSEAAGLMLLLFVCLFFFSFFFTGGCAF